MALFARALFVVCILHAVTLMQAYAETTPPPVAVLGHMEYQDGYAEYLKSLGRSVDRLTGEQLEAKENLNEYAAIFVALGIDKPGVSGNHQKRLTDYVKNGGVLVLEHKAGWSLGSIRLSDRVSPKQITVTDAGAAQFGLEVTASSKYNGSITALTPSDELAVLAMADDHIAIGYAPLGEGWVLYSGIQNSYIVQLAIKNGKKPSPFYQALMRGIAAWALSKADHAEQAASSTPATTLPAEAIGTHAPLHWTHTMRAISIKIPDQPDEEALYQQALEWRERGVNTIVDHGSFQFVPNLPDSNPQYELQVNYHAAAIFTRAMKRAGHRVIHHTTSTFVPIEALDYPEYKDFFSRDIRTGELALMTGNAYNDVAFADMNDPGWRTLVLARMRKYMREVQPDGFMTDEVEWLPNIYAGGTDRGSRAKFQALYGHDYPSGDQLANWDSPVWNRYVHFRYQSGGDFYRDLDHVLRDENPEAVVTGCLAGISKPWRRTWAMGNEAWLSGWSLGFFEAEEGSGPRSIIGGKNYLYPTYWPTYYREMALYNAYGEKHGFVTYMLGYPRSWGVEDSEQFYCWAMASTMGMRFWMRDYQAEPQWYAWEAEHEANLTHPRPIADVGIFFPEYSRDYRQDTLLAFRDWAGISEALAQHHVFADQLTRWHLEEGPLDRFKLIVLPSASFLSERMVAQLTDFVRRGGTLIATADSRMADPFTATPLSQQPLNDLLGIIIGSWQSDPAATTVDISSRQPATLPFPNGHAQIQAMPNTRVLAQVAGTDQPAITEYHIGSGRAIYMAGRIGTNAYHTQFQGNYEKYVNDADAGVRLAIADLVADLLSNRRRVEIDDLPERMMAQAFDALGSGNNTPRRTIHLLDSSDQLEHDQAWTPIYGTPLLFRDWSQYTMADTIKIHLREIHGIQSVELISPDFTGSHALEYAYDGEKDAWVIQLPIPLLGRYSVVVVNPIVSDSVEP